MKMTDLIMERWEIYDRIARSDGEITPEDEKALELNESNAASKLDGLYYFMNLLISHAEFLEKQCEGPLKTANRCREQAKWVKGLMEKYLLSTGQNEVSGALTRVYRYKSGTKADISKADIDSLPADLVEVKREPRRVEIKKRLEAGEKIPGCELQDVYAMRFSTAREK